MWCEPDLPAARRDLTRRVQFDGDRAGDRAQRLAPADDAGDRLLVHAVLQRDDIAVRREILLDHRRRPGGVVGFRADKGDVERLLPWLSCCASVRCRARAGTVNGSTSRIWVIVSPSLLMCLDMLGPEIDEGHVLAGLDHMRAGIAADRSRARRSQSSSPSPSPFLHIAPARDPPHHRRAPQSPDPILVRGGAAGKAMAEPLFPPG